MAMICPICSKVFRDQLQCPDCEVQLTYQPDLDVDPDDPQPRHWSRNPWGRVGVGVLMGQGLFYALSNLLKAVALALNIEELQGLFAMQVLQMVACVAGSVLIGAGQRTGAVYGALVGLWNAVIYLLVQSLQGERISVTTLYAQPLLFTGFGVLGGLLGTLIWPPLASPLPTRPTRPRREGWLFLPWTSGRLMIRQVQWTKVFIGLAIAVTGFVWAETMLDLARDASNGRFARTDMQDFVMRHEIRALAVFLGGCVAGVGTFTGSVQGSWVGLLSCILLIGTGLGGHATAQLNSSFLWTVGSVLALALAGGWFGGKLLPPVQPKVKRSLRPAPL